MVQCPEFSSSNRNVLAGAIGHRVLLQPTGDRGTATACQAGTQDGFPRTHGSSGTSRVKECFLEKRARFSKHPESPLLLSLPALPHGEIHKPLPPCTYLHNWNLSQRARRISLASSVFPWLSYVTEKLIFVLLLTSPGWFQEPLLRISFLE